MYAFEYDRSEYIKFKNKKDAVKMCPTLENRAAAYSQKNASQTVDPGSQIW